MIEEKEDAKKSGTKQGMSTLPTSSLYFLTF